MNYWDRIKAYAYVLKGDGCTGAPDLFYGDCCNEHDVHYKTGFTLKGKPISRKQADKKFLRCLKKNGKTPILGTFILPYIYYGAVRLFGQSAWDKDKSFYGPNE